MNTKPAVKLIKKEKLKEPQIEPAAEAPADPNKWSTAVKSWISEFQQQRRVEVLPPFDSLFK